MQIRHTALITAVVLLAAAPANPQALIEPERDATLPASPQQQQRPCSTPEHRQFDFWIGDWEVFNPQGQRVGSNRIDKVLGGCALHESWRGSTGHRGSSYNFYDAANGKWHQTWIDVDGAPLYINGGFENGRMRLVDDAGTSRGQDRYVGELRVSAPPRWPQTSPTSRFLDFLPHLAPATSPYL